MGAEFWEYRAPFESDSDTVKTIFARHKAKIKALTPDWPEVAVTDSPVPEFFTLAQIADDFDLDDDDEFLDEIERGTGYYRIDYEGKTPKSVYFFGYSCD